MTTMTTQDGLDLRVRADDPPQAPRARIVLIHGIGDHVDGVPLLVLHGTADTFTPLAAIRQFWERAGAADKTYKTYDGAYHNLFVETNREEICDDIAAWIGART